MPNVQDWLPPGMTLPAAWAKLPLWRDSIVHGTTLVASLLPPEAHFHTTQPQFRQLNPAALWANERGDQALESSWLVTAEVLADANEGSALHARDLPGGSEGTATGRRF